MLASLSPMVRVLETQTYRKGHAHRPMESTDSIFKQRTMQPRSRDLAAKAARVLLWTSCPLIQRAQGMPGARCARSLVRKTKKRTSVVTTVTPVHPTFPAQWFTAYNALSPVTGLFCHRRLRGNNPRNLTPASA